MRLSRSALASALAIALALALPGCALPGGEDAATVAVDPPASTGEWARCPPATAIPIIHPLRSEVWSEPRPEGIHRLDARTFHWVWRNYTDDLHEDELTRVNPVELARDADGTLHLCTRADVSTPVEVDDGPRTYAVGLRIRADTDLPEGPIRVTVNWAAGCSCGMVPRGNVTALFDG